MNISPAEAFLSSIELLRRYYRYCDGGGGNAFTDMEELKSILYLELRSEHPYKPDYFYKNIRDMFFQNVRPDSVRGYIIKSFKEINERFVYFRTNRIFIKSALFEEWQNLITKLPPLPILAFSIYDKCRQSSKCDEDKLVEEILKNSSIPSIYEPEIEDLIAKEGLSEIHLHLNGTTEADFVWQDALSHPVKFYNYIKQARGRDKKVEMSEQYMQLGDFKYDDVYRLVKFASSIRDSLISDIDNCGYGAPYYGNKHCEFNLSFTVFNKYNPLLFPDKIHPYRRICFGKTLFNAIQYEALFLIKAFSHLENYKDEGFASLLHFYILVYSFCNRLLSQQTNQTGFEQFLKIADNKLREFSEEKYAARFKQLQGMYGRDLIRLEGRFAPKKEIEKNVKILRSIIKDYKNVKKKDTGNNNDSLRYDLSLIAHFIKEKDKTKPKIAPYRDSKLRTKAEQNLSTLNCSLRYIRDWDKYFCGFDAANNELYARPEVFGPVFRKARFMGFNSFTFHAGEDFVHLLSGIRAVYEAVDFLGLAAGDRIGHATAVGIEPGIWLDRNGKSVIIEKGEWFDDLVFAYFLIDRCNCNFSHRSKLSEKIKELFYEIYEGGFSNYGNRHVQNFEISDIIKAWKLRKLDPKLSFGIMRNALFDEFKNLELKDIFKYRYEKKYDDMDLEKDIDSLRIYRTTNRYFYDEKKDFKIFRAYHSGKTIEESKKLIEVKTDDIFDENILRTFQDTVINELNNKRISVEALPTSNLRISHYKNYGEHHIFRWLGIDKDYNYADNSNASMHTSEYNPKPIVCLGSDDPGIFSTNVRNEFSHIFCSLIEKGMDRKRALGLLREIAENNRIYGFSFNNSITTSPPS